jgi:hypothetical protein
MALYDEGLSQQMLSINSRQFDASQFSIFPVRVKFTFLNLEEIKTTYPNLYERYGNEYSLGGILVDSVTNPTPPPNDREKELEGYTFALPLFPNAKQIPLLNEITYLLAMPSPNLQNKNFIDTNDVAYYYFHPVNLWNSIHHNALPDPLATTTKTPSEQKSYRQVEAGSRVKPTDGVDDIPLGQTFDEKANIKNLQPYEGDHIIEGRWGQSIRFGSTVTGSNNTWSSTGTNGDPILIIRNGQYNDKKEAWYPIVENINLDTGSIYFGSTQKIPLDASSTNYSSYDTAPTIPKEYSYSQIIINSGRLVFNSYEDHILLTSKKSVGLNAVQSVNIDTPKTIIKSEQIYLGSKNQTDTEPLLLGDRTYEILKTLIDDVNSLAKSLSTQVGVPAGTLLAPTATIAQAVLSNTTKLKTEVEKIRSDISRTK